MPAAHERIEFAPPPPPGRARALALALLAHVLLMLALTWGITWNRESQDMSVEAELWASVPQEAAPRAAAPPPQPQVVQAPPVPQPAPPEPKVEAPPPPAPPRQPDIAVEREKRRQEEAERRRAELEQQKKIEARKRQEELEREKKLEARRKKEEQDRRELAERKAAEKKKQEELAKAKAREQQEARLRETLRQQQMDRMRSLAGGTGRDDAKGTADRSAGPSDSYAGRIRARVKPNITFTDDIPGNPTAEIEVRMAPDGTITSKRVVKSSGVRSWDEAVLRALDKTEVLPRDVDGRVHSPLIIEFRPKG